MKAALKRMFEDLVLVLATMVLVIGLIVVMGMLKTSKEEGIKTTSVVSTDYGVAMRTSYTWCFVTSYKDSYIDGVWFKGMQVFGYDNNPYSLLTAEG